MTPDIAFQDHVIVQLAASISQVGENMRDVSGDRFGGQTVTLPLTGAEWTPRLRRRLARRVRRRMPRRLRRRLSFEFTMADPDEHDAIVGRYDFVTYPTGSFVRQDDGNLELDRQDHAS